MFPWIAGAMQGAPMHSAQKKLKKCITCRRSQGIGTKPSAPNGVTICSAFKEMARRRDTSRNTRLGGAESIQANLLMEHLTHLLSDRRPLEPALLRGLDAKRHPRPVVPEAYGEVLGQPQENDDTLVAGVWVWTVFRRPRSGEVGSGPVATARDRSGPGSSPWPRPRRSLAGTLPARRRPRSTPRRHAARSWSRRSDRPESPST